MRRFLLALVMLLPAGISFGADLQLKTRPPVVVKCNWCGFTLGIHAGYGWTRAGFGDTALLDAINFGEIEPAGFNVGAQARHLWQSGAFVFGFEVDTTWWTGRQTVGLFNRAEVPVALTNTLKLDYTASARAVLGMEVGSPFLVYITGGPAFGHAEGDLTIGAVTLNAPANHFGYKVGGGVQTKLGESLIFGVEGMWSDLGRSTYAFGAGVDVPARLQATEVRARFDWKLN